MPRPGNGQCRVGVFHAKSGEELMIIKPKNVTLLSLQGTLTFAHNFQPELTQDSNESV